ncbi:MAG: flagellar biosynthesis protein FlhB [Proteobacteria bacterium]|nr:flagellar biosynthesis protein FlhB [Pseudomonadota bacterium]
MSDTNDAASKTEEATPRKLSQARERGEVVKTADLPQLMSLTAVGAVLLTAGGGLCKNLMNALTPFIASPETVDFAAGGGMQVFRTGLMAVAPFLAMVVGAACVAGVFGNVIQTGLIFSTEAFKPDLNKLNPLEGFKRVYSIDGLMQFVKSLAKVAVTGALAYWVVRPHIDELQGLTGLAPTAALAFSVDLVKRLFFAVMSFLIVVAGADWLWQRQRFMTRMRMTKEEVKEDYKQSEGDPHIKARQKQLRMQRAKRRMMAEVAKATVVVMNPTHYAVALRYDTSEAPAPLCVAKGVDSLALKIRQIAEEAGVPVLEDPPLARALYAVVEVDDVIPPAHYEAVAKIIGFILNAGREVASRRFRNGGRP